MAKKVFIAPHDERVDYKSLIPADYNPRKMDGRTLKVLMGSLAGFGWVLPVVVNRRTGNIVGGHQRATANAELVRDMEKRGNPVAEEYKRPPVIYVDVSLTREKALNIALNQISGSWDFFKKVSADQLRQNATYAQLTRRKLGKGFCYPLGLLDIELKNPEHRKLFRQTFGDRIIDFGAGKRLEAELLRRHFGVDVLVWEPFARPKNTGRVCRQLVRRIGQKFLTTVGEASRGDYGTVFCNFVLSSIAQTEDRLKVLRILAATTRRAAERCVISVRSTTEPRYQQLLGRINSRSSFLGIPDASEPGLVVTHAGKAQQKFQKFYDPDEFVDLAEKYFRNVVDVSPDGRSGSRIVVASKPRPYRRSELAEALHFEFNLKIEGKPLGLGDRAIELIT